MRPLSRDGPWCGWATVPHLWRSPHPQGAVKLTHLKLERLPASKEDETAFSKLLADNWLYRVRVPGQALHPETAAETGVYAASFLPARCLAAAGYQEAWAIHSDAAGNLLSLEFTPPGGACAPDADDAGRGKAVPAGLAFRTVSVAFKAARDAPSLASTPNFDLEAALSQGAGAGEASGGVPDPLGGGAVPGEPPKEKSFMQKYGMVIWVLGIQVVLHVVKGTVAPEEPQQGQGAQRPAAVTAAK